MSLHGETRIADDAQHVVVIAFIPLHGLLIVGGEHHLGSSTLALGSGMGVQRFCREVLRLRQDVVIEVRQHRRVEADVVLDEQNHLNTGLVDVVVDVHSVLYQLDNREDEVRVAQPANKNKKK